MSCLHCTHNQNNYSYSGSDMVNIDVVTEGETVFSLNDKSYLCAQVQFCLTCKGLWFLHFYYPDHPPMIVGGTYITRDMLEIMFESNGKTKPFLEDAFSGWLDFEFFDWYQKVFGIDTD